MGERQKVSKHIIDVEVIPDDKLSKLKKSINAVDITTFDKNIKPPNAIRINKTSYVNTETGEIKTFNRNRSNQRDKGSLSKTFKRLRELIRHNFIGDKSEIFLTLTFKTLVDNTELSTKFEIFWNRLNTYMNGAELRCIVVVEPLDFNQYHLHCLLKRLDGKRLFILQPQLLNLWNNGRVYVTKLWNPKGLSMYLSSLYVSKKKTNIKFFPNNLQIYRRYGKFEKINKFEMTHGSAIRMVKDEDYILDEINSFVLVDDKLNVTYNKVTEEFWLKNKRK